MTFQDEKNEKTVLRNVTTFSRYVFFNIIRMEGKKKDKFHANAKKKGIIINVSRGLGKESQHLSPATLEISGRIAILSINIKSLFSPREYVQF